MPVLPELSTNTTTITTWRRNMEAYCYHPRPGCHRMWRRLISTVRAVCLSPGGRRATVPPLGYTTAKPLRPLRMRMRSTRRATPRIPLWRVSDDTMISCSTGARNEDGQLVLLISLLIPMKMAVLWDVAPYRMVDIDRPFQMIKTIAQHSRRQPFSYSSPWGPEISPVFIPFVCRLIQTKVQR
jgi:hypothetical protein